MTDRESSITGDDTGEDLYHDLPAFQYDEQIAQLEKDNKVYKEETALLTQKVNEEASKNVYLEKENDALKVNISILLQTAKSELQRKDNMINDLRREISNITFRRNKKVTKDQDTMTDIDLLIDVYKRALHENNRNSVSSVSSGSKASECDDDKSLSKSQEKKKVEFKETEETSCSRKKKSRSRERDERLDYNKERKPERGREDEYSRRRDSKPDSTGSRDFKFTSSSRSRFDKFHESPRSREKGPNKYNRSRSWYVPSERHDSDFKKSESRKRSRNGRYDRRRESPEFRRRDSPETKRKESSPGRRRGSPDFKRKESPEIRKRDSLESRRKKSCDRSKSRERSKGDSDISKEHTGDLREAIKNKSRHLSSEKQTDKKQVKNLNGGFKLEKSPPLKENIISSDTEIKCSNDNKKEIKNVCSEREAKNISSKSLTKIVSSQQEVKSDTLNQDTKNISSDSSLVSKDNNRTEIKNKINVSEYLKRKNSLNSEKNKKHVFDTISPLEALYCDMQKDEGVLTSHLSKNSGKVVDKSKNLQDESDYGEDWALSFKNERVNKAKPKTLYTRRMEEKLLGISAAERIRENSKINESIFKEEKIAVNSSKDEEQEEEKEKEKGNLLKQVPKNLKKDKIPKKVAHEEKEPGEISDDENQVETKENSCTKSNLNDAGSISNNLEPVLNDSGPITNDSGPPLNDSERSSSEKVKFSSSDTCSEMETILELPKTPDIRDSINNSSLNGEVCHDQIGERPNESITEKEAENFPTASEKSVDEKFQEGMQKLLEIQRESVTEFSPFKNNYKLIKISPLKPIEASYRSSRINGMKQIENLGDTPKKSDVYNKDDAVRLEENSRGQNNQLETSLDLSKSIETNCNKSSEDKELNVTPSEERNEAKPVEESEETPNTRNKSGKRRSVRGRNTDLIKKGKKELQESAENNARETASSQKSDKEGRSTRSKSKSQEKVIEKVEKPKTVRNNKRKREESVEKVKKEPRKRKKSQETKKEPAKKMKKEVNKSTEEPSILEETEPEVKQDVSGFEFFKPKQVTPTEKHKQLLTIQEKASEMDETSFSNSWTTTLSSKMSGEGRVVRLETPSKCMEEFKNLIINEQPLFKTGSIFSPLPCANVNDFMTPRRMLRNDLMLTDSEEESPIKAQVRKVNQVNEVAESVESDESEEESGDSSGNDSDSGASDFVDLL